MTDEVDEAEGDDFLVHVRRYATGETFSLTSDEVESGTAFDDIVPGGLDEVPFSQAAFRCPLQAPQLIEEQQELIEDLPDEAEPATAAA